MVGHSLGAAAAVTIAHNLASENVPVALIVSLDPYAAGGVPRNVRRVVNFHVGRAELAANSDFRGALRNLNVGGEEGMDHMTIQATDAMHRRIMNAIGAR
jgi:thioesterase domain-containing protein